jgi:hypothetical protein
MYSWDCWMQVQLELISTGTAEPGGHMHIWDWWMQVQLELMDGSTAASGGYTVCTAETDRRKYRWDCAIQALHSSDWRIQVQLGLADIPTTCRARTDGQVRLDLLYTWTVLNQIRAGWITEYSRVWWKQGYKFPKARARLIHQYCGSDGLRNHYTEQPHIIRLS